MAIISSIKIQNLVDVTLLITCITMHKDSLPMNLKKRISKLLRLLKIWNFSPHLNVCKKTVQNMFPYPEGGYIQNLVEKFISWASEKV